MPHQRVEKPLGLEDDEVAQFVVISAADNCAYGPFFTRATASCQHGSDATSTATMHFDRSLMKIRSPEVQNWR